jgi:DNA-directed RNA polymerase sigma subunit (sigma70/sigma32)
MLYVTQDDALVDGAEDQVWNRLEVARLMEKLNDRERFVVIKRLEGYTLREIANMCGVGHERIRQNIAKALKIMRTHEYRWDQSAHYLMGGRTRDFMTYGERYSFVDEDRHAMNIS